MGHEEWLCYDIYCQRIYGMSSQKTFKQSPIFSWISSLTDHRTDELQIIVEKLFLDTFEALSNEYLRWPNLTRYIFTIPERKPEFKCIT